MSQTCAPAAVGSGPCASRIAVDRSTSSASGFSRYPTVLDALHGHGCLPRGAWWPQRRSAGIPATHLYLQQNFATEPSVEPRQENNEPLMLVQCTFIFRASRENHGSPEGPCRNARSLSKPRRDMTMLSDAAFVQLSDALAREIGPDAVTTEPSDLGGHASDWSGLIGATPSLAVS